MEVSSHALTARQGARDQLRRRRLHQPDPGPPRLPRGHGGLLQRPSACSSRVDGQAARRRGEHRRRVRRAPRRTRSPRRYGDGLVTFSAAGSGRGPEGQRTSSSTRRARASSSRARSARRASRCRCPATSTSRTPWPRSGAAAALGRRRARGRARAGERRPGAGQDGADRRGPAVRRPRRLRAHAGLARERPRGGAAAHAGAGAGHLRVRLRRRPRPRQAPADGRDRRPPGRRARRHLGQPSLGGPGGDRRRDHARA